MRPYQLDPLFAGVGALPGIGPKTVPLYDKLLGDAGHGARDVQGQREACVADACSTCVREHERARQREHWP